MRMGKSLNLRVIAEGVESLNDQAFLQEYDCDEAQGFYFRHPIPADRFAKQNANGMCVVLIRLSE
jgi:EAL domain-containing protein (putative c-di-GMP-specific phosphodiesterase class I)